MSALLPSAWTRLDDKVLRCLPEHSGVWLCAWLTGGSCTGVPPEVGEVGGQDQWSPRVSQALRFDALKDAERIIAGFGEIAAAWEYVVVRI
jgi:hypothetical protein